MLAGSASGGGGGGCSGEGGGGGGDNSCEEVDWEDELLVVAAEVFLGWEAVGVDCCVEVEVSSVGWPCGMDDWLSDDIEPVLERGFTTSLGFSHVCLDVTWCPEGEGLDDGSMVGGGSGCFGLSVNWVLAGTSPGELCSTEAFIEASMEGLCEPSGCALSSCSKSDVDLWTCKGRTTG